MLDFLSDAHWIEQSIFIFSILIFASILTWFLRWALRVFIDKNSKLLKVEPTNYRFLKHAVSLIIYGAALTIIFYQIPSLKSLATGLFAGAGIFAAVIAFASQAAFSNIISGIFIVVFKPFRVEDIIEFDSVLVGEVKDITLRHTVIVDFENKHIIIPNSQISSKTIINFSIDDPKLSKHLYFRISLDSDVDKAIEIIRDQILSNPKSLPEEEIKKITNGEGLRVKVTDIGEYYINIRAWVWAANAVDAWNVCWDANIEVLKRFKEAGIETPVPYRKIVSGDKPRFPDSD